jgi:hypothetical protein
LIWLKGGIWGKNRGLRFIIPKYNFITNEIKTDGLREGLFDVFEGENRRAVRTGRRADKQTRKKKKKSVVYFTYSLSGPIGQITTNFGVMGASRRSQLYQVQTTLTQQIPNFHVE